MTRKCGFIDCNNPAKRKNKDNPKKTSSSPNKNNNPNSLLYIGLGIAGVIIAALIIWLIFEKKQ